MTKELISADQARKNAENFDLSADQIVGQMAESISANSKAGSYRITMSFKKSAVSLAEIEKAIAAVKAKGFKASIDDVQPKESETTIRIEW